ncbi:MAG: GIY-YIG nuclease family protein [Thermoplasmata archaeon]|nr:GIY-YIG nuclease family protein [Thermoplasmata archaeon]
MKGSYVLLIKLDRERKIRVGALGEIYFKPGYYAYVGSAMNGIEARVSRHLRKNKKMRWHVDYLLQYAEVERIYYKQSNEKEECSIASLFSLPFIPRFGSSDCKCKSHLFYSEKTEEIDEVMKKAGMKILERLNFK